MEWHLVLVPVPLQVQPSGNARKAKEGRGGYEVFGADERV